MEDSFVSVAVFTQTRMMKELIHNKNKFVVILGEELDIHCHKQELIIFINIKII
jgi:hypothetical protein